MNLMYVKISCSVKFLLPGMRPFFLESRGVVALVLDSPVGVAIFFFLFSFFLFIFREGGYGYFFFWIFLDFILW